MNTISDAINRGYNLLCISIISLAGFAFFPEAFLEKDVEDKMDDTGLFLIGIAGIVWYVLRRNRYARSIVPPLLVCLSLIVKVIGLAIEFSDPDAAGDDFGGVVLFVCAAVLVLYQYAAVKKLLGSANAPAQ